ncbi:hypothetical protein PLESTB_001252000 [Pleodorina starrii]|uniref:Uncharacterized protein n=1 Tax=Pleodorina starrii TaxID=330485 RepID=A0A9W6BTH2_9CHLO|nr:hypothetical protein PLESTB_001252000 [Pleodorina starrii]GLC63339.1 hypothetical protein PLESTF_000025800 [Pleodorina starrii]
MFREQDFGVAIVIDRAGLAKRGRLAGYASFDAALKAVLAIVRGAGMRPIKLISAESTLTSTASSISRSGPSWSSISGIISSHGSSAYFNHNTKDHNPLLSNTHNSNIGHHGHTGLAGNVGVIIGSSNTFFFAGPADALQCAMCRLRLAAWLRHTPGRTDVGRFYAVYPRGPNIAKYVAQDYVFNEL